MGSDQSSRRQEVVKHGDKQGRLDQFLGFYLDRIFADWTDRPEQHKVMLIARSPASPVARAVIANAPDLLSAGIEIRVVFSQLDPSDLMSEWTDIVLVSAESDLSPNAELSLIKNPALIDAHELIVLGSDMSWCGDAMRRDPLHRDTVEVFDPCCPNSAAQNARSFEALWQRSEVIRVASQKPSVNRKLTASDQEDNPMPQAPGTINPTLASTRH